MERLRRTIEGSRLHVSCGEPTEHMNFLRIQIIYDLVHDSEQDRMQDTTQRRGSGGQIMRGKWETTTTGLSSEVEIRRHECTFLVGTGDIVNIHRL